MRGAFGPSVSVAIAMLMFATANVSAQPYQRAPIPEHPSLTSIALSRIWKGDVPSPQKLPDELIARLHKHYGISAFRLRSWLYGSPSLATLQRLSVAPNTASREYGSGPAVPSRLVPGLWLETLGTASTEVQLAEPLNMALSLLQRAAVAAAAEGIAAKYLASSADAAAARTRMEQLTDDQQRKELDVVLVGAFGDNSPAGVHHGTDQTTFAAPIIKPLLSAERLKIFEGAIALLNSGADIGLQDAAKKGKKVVEGLSTIRDLYVKTGKKLADKRFERAIIIARSAAERGPSIGVSDSSYYLTESEQAAMNKSQVESATGAMEAVSSGLATVELVAGALGADEQTKNTIKQASSFMSVAAGALAAVSASGPFGLVMAAPSIVGFMGGLSGGGGSGAGDQKLTSIMKDIEEIKQAIDGILVVQRQIKEELSNIRADIKALNDRLSDVYQALDAKLNIIIDLGQTSIKYQQFSELKQLNFCNRVIDFSLQHGGSTKTIRNLDYFRASELSAVQACKAALDSSLQIVEGRWAAAGSLYNSESWIFKAVSGVPDDAKRPELDVMLDTLRGLTDLWGVDPRVSLPSSNYAMLEQKRVTPAGVAAGLSIADFRVPIYRPLASRLLTLMLQNYHFFDLPAATAQVMEAGSNIVTTSGATRLEEALGISNLIVAQMAASCGDVYIPSITTALSSPDTAKADKDMLVATLERNRCLRSNVVGYVAWRAASAAAISYRSALHSGSLETIKEMLATVDNGYWSTLVEYDHNWPVVKIGQTRVRMPSPDEAIQGRLQVMSDQPVFIGLREALIDARISYSGYGRAISNKEGSFFENEAIRRVAQ